MDVGFSGYISAPVSKRQEISLSTGGGGANTKGLVPFLSKKLGREIELGNPWVNVRFNKELPIIEHKQALQYSTAIGLALKGIHYEDIY